MKKNLLIMVVMTVMSNFMFSQTVTEETKPILNVTGFADAYYQYAFKGTTSATSFTEQPNSFTLGMASVKLEKTVKNVGIVADLGWGPRAENANGSIGTSLASIKQLYVTCAPSDKLKFTFGNFFTFVGYEVVDAPLNMNYSTSYAFSKGPFFHTGLKGEYNFNDNWSALVGVFNETDKKFAIGGPSHAGVQLSYHKDKFKGYLNYLGGKVRQDSTGLMNQQVDLTCTYQATEKLGLGLNATQKYFLRSDKSVNKWSAVVLYQNYAFTEKFTLALREEAFLDGNGEALGTLDNSVFAATLSGNYKINDLTLITEFRLDHSNKDSFQNSKKSVATNQLPVFLFAAVYAF
jgi:hypothetical protein